MGASQSSPPPLVVSITDILGADVVDWDLASRALREDPDCACLYLHSVEPSQLQVALSRSAPPAVVSLFVDAYEDALFHSDRDGSTAAHSCVDSTTDCYEGLQILLQRNPSLALQCNKMGRLPLHMNVLDAQAAQLLIETNPPGLRQRDIKGRAPLHYALSQEEIEINVVRVMVNELQDKVLMRDKRGTTPLDLLIKKLGNYCDEDGETLSREGLLLWDTFVDILRWVIDPDESSTELHKILDLRCPLHVVLHALKVFPQQVSQRNARGRTPLHIAAIRQDSGAVITKLVSMYPPAARMTDEEGRLAIDLAAEHGKDSGVMEALICAEPRAVDTRDLRDKRYPFISAAMGDHETVATTYYLLRAKPHVISYFHLQ